MLRINPLNHPICLATPNRLTAGAARHEHIPFAMFLVDLLRPKVIVELGTHHGDFYCALCQAVKELRLDTACYAVDTWKGVPHAGLDGPEVLADLRAHHDPLYGGFSRLIQSTFDEALKQFTDGTVDLLHIDGYHTGESVRRDFESWLPKMRQHGVVLFHHINSGERVLGIRQFWDEVRAANPHFNFLHIHGLGVLAVGKARSRGLRELFELPEEESIRIRDFFFQLGDRLATTVREEAVDSELHRQKEPLDELEARLQEKDARIAKLEARLAAVRSSFSWRITAPLRAGYRGYRWFVRNTPDTPAWISKQVWSLLLSRAVRTVYRHMPMPLQGRIRIRDMVFSTVGAIAEPTPTAIMALVDNNEYDHAISIISAIKKRRGERKPFLAIEGIAYLRMERFDRAEALWSEYWQRALNDKAFASDTRVELRSQCKDSSFAFTRFCPEDGLHDDLDVRFCVYTALFGDYDELRPPLYQPSGVDFICFSDRPRDARGWEIRVVDPGMNTPVLQNRRIKILPYQWLVGYDCSIYVDSSVCFLGDPLLMYYRWLRGKKFVAWRHPQRSGVYEECEAILAYLRQEPISIIAQYKYYKQQQVPRQTGLIEARFLWRDHRDKEVSGLMEKWWEQVLRFDGRDQPALAYCMWSTGLRPEVMPEYLGDSRRNEFYYSLPHRVGVLDLERVRAEQDRTGDSAPRIVQSHGGHTLSDRLGINRHQRLSWVYSTRFKAVASTVMRGHQLSEIARKGLDDAVNVDCVDESIVETLRHSIVILTKGFLKNTTAAELSALKRRGNIVCADYVDDRARIDLHEAIDVYIAASIKQFVHYVAAYSDKVVHLITHACDPRVHGIRNPTGYCSIGYFGEMANAAYRRELQGLIDFCLTNTKVADADTTWIELLQHYNVHYSVRNRRPFDGFKPFLKGFTAAHCHANIIVPIEESDACYYLGSDYPFILKDDSLNSVLEMIEHVKESFGGPEWRRGLEIMSSVRNRSAPTHVIHEIKDLVVALS